MDPVVQQVLLSIWLVVGGVLTLILGLAAAWKSGFHIRSQRNQVTGMVEDSALKWLLILAVLFVGPPAVLLGMEYVTDFLYAGADYWWLGPVAAASVALVTVCVWWVRRTLRPAEGGEVHPGVALDPTAMWMHVADDGTRTLIPPTYGSLPPYGQYGDGHL